MKNLYKKMTLSVFAFMTIMVVQAQVKVGSNPTTINSDAVMELESSNKGFRLSRVALTASNLPAPLTAHVEGMVVYNTATAGTFPNAVTPGLYYNDGAKWQAISSGSGSGAGGGGVGGTTLKTSETGIATVLEGRLKKGIDVGGSTVVTFAATEYEGFITSATSSPSGGYSVLTINMADQGTIDYDIFTSMYSSASVATGSTGADGNNDFTFPLVFNKTPTSFQIFVEETSSTPQNVFFSFLLTKYTANTSATTSNIQKGQLFSYFDIGAGTSSYPVVSATSYNGFISNVTYAQGASNGSVITVTMADQGTTEYDVYTSIKSLASAYSGSNSANSSNNFLFPLIFNKTATSFQVYLQESASDVQAVAFDFILTKKNGVGAVPVVANVPSTVLKGRIQTTIDVGSPTYPSAVYDGFITNAGFEYGSGGGVGYTVMTVYIPDQGTTNYEIFNSYQSGVIAIADANVSNDFTFPLIFGKTTNSFKVFLEENASNTQQVKFSFLLVK
jgi:hypothetical protein